MSPACFKTILRNLALRLVQGALLLATLAATAVQAEPSAPADWFPEQPDTPRYQWLPEPCPGCAALEPRPEWLAMAGLAGVRKIHFLSAPGEDNGPAYSVAPDGIALAPSALALEGCRLSFVVGHEIAHIALRHFDEDALTMAALSGRRSDWTSSGNEAIHLLDDNFPLAFRMADFWQMQEREADWVGSLLAAEACGCRIEESALPFLRQEEGYGGGIAASHQASAERARFLQSFAASARRLAERSY